MKKNLLFVMPGLSAGGGEKSLVNLLSQIDYGRYNVDLFLFNHDGLFMDFVPDSVRIVPIPETYRMFALPIYQSIKKLLAKGQFALAYNRFLFTMRNRKAKNISIREQYNWKYISKSMDKLNKKYDAAIGFMEKTSTYFCVDKADAVKKIGWVHIDYDKLGMDPNYDGNYFNRLDHIVTVSEECANILRNRFPDHKSKVEVIYNIVSPAIIRNMADQASMDVFNKGREEIVILSIGRLHEQKGFDLAIESCKILVDKGYNIKWHIIGEGEERAKLTELISASGLGDHVKLLGLKSNPYPYIRQADIYAQTSRYEGKSIAIDEAKILNKPIIVTNFSTAKDQITDDVDGLIVEMNAQAIANGIERLIREHGLRNTLQNNLSRLKLGTEQEINKLYQLFQQVVR